MKSHTHKALHVPSRCGISGKESTYVYRKHSDTAEYRVMRHLTTGIRFEKCVVRRFRRCANVIECTYTNLDSTVQSTTHPGYMI